MSNKPETIQPELYTERPMETIEPIQPRYPPIFISGEYLRKRRKEAARVMPLYLFIKRNGVMEALDSFETRYFRVPHWIKYHVLFSILQWYGARRRIGKKLIKRIERYERIEKQRCEAREHLIERWSKIPELGSNLREPEKDKAIACSAPISKELLAETSNPQITVDNPMRKIYTPCRAEIFTEFAMEQVGLHFFHQL
jgi:hypothetical protein